MKTRVVLCSLLVVALMMGPMGCGSKVSKDNFDKVQNGMTLKEVEGILGKGEAQAAGAGALGGLTGSGQVYKWVDGEKSITVTFANDKVVAKVSSGF
jgi:hypothetical protein